MENLIRTSQLAKELFITRQTIYNWIKAGKIKVVKLPNGFNYLTKDDYYSLLDYYKNKTKVNA